jgi:hypothetical protein
MKKTTTPAADPWDNVPAEPNTTKPIIEDFVEHLADEPIAYSQPASPASLGATAFDMEGLMTDFPTATELQKFVYDETGIALNLKGRANKLKYQIALDTLNGIPPADEFIGRENPYLDKNDLVPEEPLQPEPARDPELPPLSETQNVFHCKTAPHPDPACRAQDQYAEIEFRKYRDGTISYRVLGPILPRPHGEKIDKFGRTRPEIIKWVDPRTGERIVRRSNGSMTTMGLRLKALMQSADYRVNKSTQWDVWIDRNFGQLNQGVIDNPWLE